MAGDPPPANEGPLKGLLSSICGRLPITAGCKGGAEHAPELRLVEPLEVSSHLSPQVWLAFTLLLAFGAPRGLVGCKRHRERLGEYGQALGALRELIKDRAPDEQEQQDP